MSDGVRHSKWKTESTSARCRDGDCPWRERGPHAKVVRGATKHTGETGHEVLLYRSQYRFTMPEGGR